MTTATIVSDLNGAGAANRNKTVVGEAVLGKTVGTSALSFERVRRLAASAYNRGYGFIGRIVRRLGLDRAYAFVRPYVDRAFGYIRQLGIIPGLTFSLTTHRGRGFLLDRAPRWAARVVTFPVRLLWRGLSAGLNRLGSPGKRVVNFVNTKSARLTKFASDSLINVETWLADRHDSNGMRLVRNASFMVLVYNAASFIPNPWVKAAAIVIGFFLPTGHITINGDTMTESPALFVADMAIAVLPAVDAAEEALESAPGANREARRYAERVAKRLDTTTPATA